MSIDTARLTERITILQQSISATTMLERVETYTPVKIIAATILNQRGSTSFDNGYVYSDRLSFFVRYLPIISLADKKKFLIEYNCQRYEIENITTVGRREATIIDVVGIR
jgi:hypothetical protein